MIQKPMMLVNSIYGEGYPTFALMPVTQDCPYLEAIYDPHNKIMLIISKEKKDSLHMLEKLDNLGQPVKTRIRVAKDKIEEVVVRERKLINENYHYTLYTKDEIESFIEAFAYNNDKFDYKKFFIIGELQQGIEVPTGAVQAEA